MPVEEEKKEETIADKEKITLVKEECINVIGEENYIKFKEYVDNLNK